MTSLQTPPRRAASRQRVLVVDDERPTLEAIAAILQDAGYETVCLESSGEALAALERDRFHLVVTDLYLGEGDLGYAIADAARDCRPAVPVIVLTGRPTFGGACEAVRAHVREFVVKPVDGDRLVTTCRNTIESAEIERKTRQLEAQNRVLCQVVPRMIEAKDPTTSGHADRVIHYTDRLAERCGVSDEDRESLRLASLMHDLGKIGVSRAILCKPGPLNRDERREIERHPEIGYEILAPLEHCEDVRVWVYQHHERWDGRGYPNGLTRDEVALPGRILVLAEVYDALAEARSYKPAWPVSRIVDFFRHEAGRHFDPDLAHLVADGLARDGRDFFGPPAVSGLFDEIPTP